MYGCEVMWTDEKAARVQALVEESTGEKCPCKVGRPCPVIPVDLVLPAPRHQVRIDVPEIS